MADEQKFFYSNALEVQSGGYDMTLKFLRMAVSSGLGGQIKPGVTLNATPTIQDSISICLSPEHAKAILGSLITAVITHENSTGAKIALPKDGQAVFDAAIAQIKNYK